MKFEKSIELKKLHSLLNINCVKKKIQSNKPVTNELTKLIKELIYNKNIDFNKNLLTPDKNKPKLNIFISNFSEQIDECDDDYRIIIGKKIENKDNKTLLNVNTKNFKTDIYKIEKIVYNGLKDMKYSEIYLIYNHYYKYGDVRNKTTQLFPLTIDGRSFDGPKIIPKTDIDETIIGFITFYILCQIQTSLDMSIASENVFKKQTLDISLKKLKNSKGR